MTKLSFATTLILGILLATGLAQAEDFDKDAATAATAKLGKQVDAIAKSFDAIPADEEGQSAEQRRVVREDLKHIEGHAKHVSSGLHEGLDKAQTEPAVESMLGLIKKVGEDAKGANIPEPMQAQIADAQITIKELAGIYGISLSDVAAPKPE